MQESIGKCNPYSPQAVPRDIPEVRQALGTLEDVTCRYDDLVLRLSDKLASITTPELAAGSNKPESKYQTSLANELDTLYHRLKTITNTLESLYSRLEI